MEYLESTELQNSYCPARQTTRKYYKEILALLQGFFLIASFVSFTACQERAADTPTQGKIAIAVDESFQPLIQAEVDAFQAAYKYAKVTPIYTTEAQAMRLMLADSVRSVIITRSFSAEELEFYAKRKITPDSLKIATEAVALIVNKKNADSLLTMNRFRAILNGSIKTWKEVSGQGPTKDIVIVFDNGNSSNLSFIKRKFGLGNDFDKKIYAAQSNKKVIEYVQQNENAIGLIGVSWISDVDDPKQQFARKDVSVVALAEKDDPTIDDYYQPYAAYLKTKQYPLYRDLYIVSGEARKGLGTGFAAYVASEKGQLIILKAGLLPATQPIRLVKVNAR
ncbi:substrate-binding domain-containing protein [Cytophagaceae bacterium DM2B3-1]|uniref:Substrate-binding domain-containing protein n=1 Tax=Xanthocytophaga flava TaxID=3048013 RepID=A0ABT7CCF7_9BACT|nr:substrate-binding domain-containing protein [Xanthocytophaga flavus]MDJ1491374.1 substrate-binding domain-containing protein [Xanthocytophaga flavus]